MSHDGDYCGGWEIGGIKSPQLGAGPIRTERMATFLWKTFGLALALGLAACGSASDNDGARDNTAEGADAPAGATTATCTRVLAADTLGPIDVEHLVRAVPPAMLTVEDSSAAIGMRGSLQDEARLELRFKHCLDLSRVANVVFDMSGRGGAVDVALDSPTNLRAPEGTCVEQYCYSPRSPEFLESPGSSAQARWSDFTSGSPAAGGDPEHILGLTWSVKGDPGDAVDLRITQLLATTLF
jgi:hypothetical protein